MKKLGFFHVAWRKIKLIWACTVLTAIVLWTLCWLFFFPAIGVLWLAGAM